MGSIPGPATLSFHTFFFMSKRPLLFYPWKYDVLNIKQMFAMPERGDKSIFRQNKYQDPVRFEPPTFRLPIRRVTDWATGAWSNPREKLAMWFGMVNNWASLLRSKRQTFPFLSEDNVIWWFYVDFSFSFFLVGFSRRAVRKPIIFNADIMKLHHFISV